MHFTVIGAGVMGSWVALTLIERGASVEIWDASDASLLTGASLKAAGMIAPYSELDSVDTRVAHLAVKSLALWKTAAAKQASWQPHFHAAGSWAVAGPNESAEWNRLCGLLHRSFPQALPERLPSPEEWDPRFSRRIHFSAEAHVHPKPLLSAMHATLGSWGAPIQWNKSWDGRRRGSFIIDCRGLSARADWPQLRGVRGEIVLLEAPEVILPCPVRVLHPRFPIYIVPRDGNRYVVGATSIENESTEPITVRSTLELLSTAFAFHPGFAEATVVESWTGLRPAFLDHLPQLEWSDGILRANGLYRHGWMLAPEIARQIADRLTKNEEEDSWLWKSN